MLRCCSRQNLYIMSQMCLLHQSLGELTANTPSTDRVAPKQDSAAVTLPQSTISTAGSTEKQPQTAGQPVTGRNQNKWQSNTVTHQVTTTVIASVLTTTQEAVKTSPKTTNQPSKTAQLGRSTASATAGKRRRSCAL